MKNAKKNGTQAQGFPLIGPDDLTSKYDAHYAESCRITALSQLGQYNVINAKL